MQTGGMTERERYGNYLWGVKLWELSEVHWAVGQQSAALTEPNATAAAFSSENYRERR